MAIPGPASSQTATQDPLRVSINAAQSPSPAHEQPRQNIQHSTPSGPKSSTSTPNDVAKYGGRFNQGYSAPNRKPLLPVWAVA